MNKQYIKIHVLLPKYWWKQPVGHHLLQWNMLTQIQINLVWIQLLAGSYLHLNHDNVFSSLTSGNMVWWLPLINAMMQHSCIYLYECVSDQRDEVLFLGLFTSIWRTQTFLKITKRQNLMGGYITFVQSDLARRIKPA